MSARLYAALAPLFTKNAFCSPTPSPDQPPPPHPYRGGACLLCDSLALLMQLVQWSGDLEAPFLFHVFPLGLLGQIRPFLIGQVLAHEQFDQSDTL